MTTGCLPAPLASGSRTAEDSRVQSAAIVSTSFLYSLLSKYTFVFNLSGTEGLQFKKVRADKMKVEVEPDCNAHRKVKKNTFLSLQISLSKNCEISNHKRLNEDD